MISSKLLLDVKLKICMFYKYIIAEMSAAQNDFFSKMETIIEVGFSEFNRDSVSTIKAAFNQLFKRLFGNTDDC